MDYKFIEQLVERYFEAQTTLQEEEILRIFFSQENLPAEMRQMGDWFATLQQEGGVAPLGDDFDERLIALTEQAVDKPVVKARTITFAHRLMPLFKVAAVVAIVLTLGNAAQAPWDRGWNDPKEEFAKYHQQLTDSANLVQPMQAEILSDTSQTVTLPVTPPTY